MHWKTSPHPTSLDSFEHPSRSDIDTAPGSAEVSDKLRSPAVAASKE